MLVLPRLQTYDINKNKLGNIQQKLLIATFHTVVHRVLDINVRDVEVRLGKLFTNKEEPGREQLIRAKRIIIHPQFRTTLPIDYDFDVALIHLKTSAIYTDYVRPICLPLRKNDGDDILLRPGNNGIITGGV